MMYKLEMLATVSLIQVLKLEQSCGTTVAENLGSYWRTEITANSESVAYLSTLEIWRRPCLPG